MIRTQLPVLLAIAALLSGCAGSGRIERFTFDEPDAGAMEDTPTSRSADPRGLAMFSGFSGFTGATLQWDQLLDAVEWADVVFLGEAHDDRMGHQVQQALVNDAIDRLGGENIIVSMEMFTRDHQATVNAYLRDEIDSPTMIERAGVNNWGGTGMWTSFYQPTVDAAKDSGAPVIAANAPRDYVSQARNEGYDALRAMPGEEQALFALPGESTIANDAYRHRFFDAMSGSGGSHGAGPHAHQMSDEQLEALFRAQLVWDATMGESIADHATDGRTVIHLLGHFHSDFEGGAVLETRRLMPGARVLTVTILPVDATAIREEDRERADVVIYTGDPDAM